MKFFAKKAPVEEPDPRELTKFEKFKKFLDRNGYLGCSFIIPFAIMWMIFIALRVFPFGPNSVLVLDLNGQYVYFFEALRKAIFGDASLLYSWSRSLGGEFMGIYAYYIASPLSYIVALFPEQNITEALLLIILLKCGLSGGTMAWYLRKKRPQANEMITIACACMYALSSYAVVQAHNTMWIDALIWLPLVIYGTEQLIKKHKFVLFCVSLTMTVLSTFYIGYMVCIFVFLYFFYYYFAGSDKDNNYYGESFHFIKSLLRMGCAAITSLLASCIIILPTYYSLSFGKTTFSTVNWAKEITAPRFDFIQFFSKLFIGSYDTVRPEGLPFIYCGTLVLILVPLYFAAKKVSLREKIGNGALMLFLILSMNISGLDIIWHGLQKPNWLNYRYSFLLIFLMLVATHRALEEIESIRMPFLAGSSILVTIILIIVQTKGYDYVDTLYTVWLSLLFIIVYTILIIPLIKNALKPIFLTVLAIVTCVEMFAAGIINTNSLDADVTFSPRNTSSESGLEGYYDFLSRMRGIVNKIQESDTSFYRLENNDVRKVCDNHALNMRGISGSTSTLNAKTIKFLERMGYVSLSHWSQYKGATEVADALLGIKYSIYTSAQGNPLISLYDTYDYTKHNYSTGEDEARTLYAYLNSRALSVAYTSDDDILDFNITGYVSPFEMMNDMISALLGEENIEVFKKIDYKVGYDSSNTTFQTKTYSETVYDKDGNKIPLYDENGNVKKDANGNIEYKKKSSPYYYFSKTGNLGSAYFDFTVPEDIESTYDSVRIYAYLPTNYSRGAKWSCNSNSGTIYSNGSRSVQYVGSLEKGSEQHFIVALDSTELHVDSNAGMFFYIDEAEYKYAMEKLAKGNMNITSYTESKLEGTIYAEEGRTTVFTSIPYDEGWNIYVDGKKVDIDMTCAALISFDLGSAGEHTIKLSYFPKQLTFGIILTCAGVIIFAAWIVVDNLVFKKKRALLRSRLEEELSEYNEK